MKGLWRNPILRQSGLLACLWASLSAHLSAMACPTAADLTPQSLVGAWQIEWTDGGRQKGEEPWRLVLAPHPEYSGSLKGQLSRGAERHLIVADWDDEVLTLEESADGQRISATWQATATPGQCGRELRGRRTTGAEPDASDRRFRMRR
jgi:hypothetical protein